MVNEPARIVIAPDPPRTSASPPRDRFEVPIIHVWNANLSMSAKDLHRHWEVLSAGERARAARFHFDIHRSRFVAARGILRKLLANYTGQDPMAIEFLYGPNGKPTLRQCDLHFNLSHSEDRAVFAFTYTAQVGVDLEYLRFMPDMAQIAGSFFSPLEFRSISATHEPQRNIAFFRCWTRKEAIIKASGEGLTCPLGGFDVSIDVTAQCVVVNRDVAEHERFFLYDLGLCDGFVGAVACRRPCEEIALFQYGGLAG
jgi:4'-phosphopantetheinyl transferase